MTWNEFLNEQKKLEYYKILKENVDREYATYTCYPDYKNIYEALKLTPINEVKVVILGQDPYHEENQAHGLAFSTLSKELPPSLINIYKEMEDDLKIKVNHTNDLTYLARQGVLLLNTTLTVRAHMANSHVKYGWSIFTDNIIKMLNQLDQPIVFILWGNNAKQKAIYLTNPHHIIISSAHPSPLSAYNGFFGSKPFSRTNEFLRKNNIMEIKWSKD